MTPDSAHHYYYSTWRAWLLLIVIVPFALYSLVITFAAKYLIGDLALLVMPLQALFFGYVIRRAIARLRNREPIVTIDRHGIRDRRVRDVPIPWTEIRKLYLGPYRGSTSLLVAFHSSDAMRRSLGRDMGLDGFLTEAGNFINAPGAQWGVQLGPLRCSAREVLSTSQRLHSAALRQHDRQSPAPVGDA